MRILLIALTIASMTVPAFAQEDAAGSTKHHGAPKKTNEEPKVKADDKDYKSALQRLPDQKADPWGNVRPAASKK
ncbi:MAG TPA: hypothetical protein VGH49_16300 [Xanthobacteraceae bacterium]|jgi:hypothetical protein